MCDHKTPPSPCEITKLESSMRPLLESKVFSEEETICNKEHELNGKHRSQSASISPDENDSDESIEDIIEEEEDTANWEDKVDLRARANSGNENKKSAECTEITDEEFMRRQIMEMSADEEEEMEDEEDENVYSYRKAKKTRKYTNASIKEKCHFTHHSSSFEEESKSSSEMYKGSAEGEELIGSQGGLRRFKTIELNNTSSYCRDIELSNENGLGIDREPELEMESLTGSPEESIRGDYSSIIPPITSSYNSGTSPTSISSMEDDSDSSPIRRQRLEEAKQQRKARNWSHGPLLPTIEDSSEEDELREEEELLREQEKMREVEQQRIRSTARKTKRDKEELRAQRRRERSKTPPSSLSPIEDASPTEELRQAAEMEELHRSSCSEFSPSISPNLSEAERFEISSKLYKSGSEYNLPTFMSLYSPTEKPDTASITIATTSNGKPLKSAEEVYEEIMRKAEMLQKQQKLQQQHICLTQSLTTDSHQDENRSTEQQCNKVYEFADQHDTIYENVGRNYIYEEICQTSQNITKHLDDQLEVDMSYVLDTGSTLIKLLEQSNAPLTPGTSPTQLSAPVSFSETGTRGHISDVRVTQHYYKDGQRERLRGPTGKNGITPGTTVTAYGVYARDTVPTTSTSQTITTQSILHEHQADNDATATTSILSLSSKIAEITQAYNQQEVKSQSGRVHLGDNATPPDYKVYVDYNEIAAISLPVHSQSRSCKKKTAEFSTQTFGPIQSSDSFSAVIAQGTQTPHKINSSHLYRQQCSQDAGSVLIIGSEPTSPLKPVTVNTATSPLSSPTKFCYNSSYGFSSPHVSPPDTPPHQQSPRHSFYRSTDIDTVNVGTSMVNAASMQMKGSHSMENVSLCHISTVPGTVRVEQEQRLQSASVTDLRTTIHSSPIIMTDQGVELTSLATEARQYSGPTEWRPNCHSTTFHPLIINLHPQEQQHLAVSTATTVSVTVAASMFISQPKHHMVYSDPLQNRTDSSQGIKTVLCLLQNKQPQNDPFIPHIDAKLEDLNFQQQQLLKQQQKLQQQHFYLEQLHHHQLQQQQTVSFGKLNLLNQLPLSKKDLIVNQTNTAPITSALSSAVKFDMFNIGGSLELRCKPVEPGAINLINVQPQGMMVQVNGTKQGSHLTQIIKEDEGQDNIDITGKIQKENQVPCCDVIYNLPFSGSCVGGPFPQKSIKDETIVSDCSQFSSVPQQVCQPIETRQEKQPYQQSVVHDFASKSYTLVYPGQLQSSLSEMNLVEVGLQPYLSKSDTQLKCSEEMAIDSLNRRYEGGYLRLGLQYGSHTDLRQGDVAARPLPIRRYSSLSNISSDYGYSSRDHVSLQESNLAQYSAITAREIHRMCAALNSMDRYGSSPDLLQLGAGRFASLSDRTNLQLRFRPSFLYGQEEKPLSQTLTNIINARQANLRAMYPSAIRPSDGITYSTINTPIASTVPITTQPSSVLYPLFKGVYRPYNTPNMTPVPVGSLNRMSLAPRMLLSGQASYHFPALNCPSVTPLSTNVPVVITSEQDAPLFLGKSSDISSAPGMFAAVTSAVQNCQTSLNSGSIQVTLLESQSQSQQQPLNLSQFQFNYTQDSIHNKLSKHFNSKQPPPLTTATTFEKPLQGLETEDEWLHHQQDQLLKLERERIELENLRQLRLQEELEMERTEMQHHREKEHMLVQNEIQELQTIKQQVLQQQQVERENQLILQREQLAQQKLQLDQIQSIQKQLQQHLEEQKRQKTAAVTSQFVCDQTGNIIQDIPSGMQYGEMQVSSRSLPNSSSEMCLRNNDHRSKRKQRSMQDGIEGGETMFSLPSRIVNSSMQTDVEDEGGRYLMSRRRRSRRSIDCSVQTDDDEDKAVWEQPVRRRRSRFSRLSESGADPKSDTPALAVTLAENKTFSSIAIQTIQDCSCQTYTDHIGKLVPVIHVTVPDPNKVEIVHYISGPERTTKGQSLACQTEPEVHSQGVIVPQIVTTTFSLHSNNAHVASADTVSHQQNVFKLEKRKLDPLDIRYQQHHLHNESLSSVIRQSPKSPQVLYSPVSPLSSPHRSTETSILSNERLNKAHVIPRQKSHTTESSLRHHSVPRPMKNLQRSLSDPKPLSPTFDEQTKTKISLYQQQALQSQVWVETYFVLNLNDNY